MELHLKIIGALLLVLGLVHAVFPRYFKWAEELPLLSPVNRQIMQVHTFFIAIVVLLMGVGCFTDTRDLVHTLLGRHLCLGLGSFWLARLLIQFFGYSSTLWKGKCFETAVHVLFSLLWSYLTIVFLLIAMGQSFSVI